MSSFYIQNFKPPASFCGCAGLFESYLVENPEDRFSRDKAQIKIELKIKTSSTLTNKLLWFLWSDKTFSAPNILDLFICQKLHIVIPIIIRILIIIIGKLVSK